MPLDRVKANELLELVVIDQSPKARALLLNKLEECVTLDPFAKASADDFTQWHDDAVYWKSRADVAEAALKGRFV